MSLFDTIQSWWSHDAPAYLVHDFACTAVHPPMDVGEPCVAGTHYFRVWLAEMRLAQDKAWFSAWHPVVHSLVRFTFGDQQIDLPRIAGPLHLPGLDEAHLGNVVHLNHPLTSLLPYNGGTVELSAGLLALQGQNLLREFVTALDTMTQVLAQPPVSTAVSMLGPVSSAVQHLLGGSNGRLHLGLHLGFADGGGATALHDGYIAVLGAAAAQAPPAQLTVDTGALRFKGAPLSGVDYMLFRVERRAERDDWDSLASIADPFKESLRALSYRDTAAAEAFVRKAVLEAYSSPDLTRADRTRVAGEVKLGFQEARDAGLWLTRYADGGVLATAMGGAPAVEQYLQHAPPSLARLLDLDA